MRKISGNVLFLGIKRHLVYWLNTFLLLLFFEARLCT